MVLYAKHGDGLLEVNPLSLKAKCPLCGRMFPFDVAGHVLNGSSLDDNPADWPLCPDCALARSKHKEDNDDE